MRTVEDYLSNSETINNTMDTLANMNLKEMSNDKSGGAQIKCFINPDSEASIISVEKFNVSAASKITYVEMLALIKAAHYDKNYCFRYNDSSNIASTDENYLFCISKLLSFFVNCSARNRTIDVFRRMKLSDMYKYDDPVKSAQAFDLFKRLRIKYDEYTKKSGFDKTAGITDSINKKVTVGEFIRSCYLMAHSSWRPDVDDPRQYIEGIKNIYRIAGIFLIDYFIWKYSDRCDADMIKEKYRHEETDVVYTDEIDPWDLEDIPF